jgi:hypothetical protein
MTQLLKTKINKEKKNIEPIVSTRSYNFELASKLYQIFYIVHQSIL